MITRKSKHEFRISVGDTSLVPYSPDDLRKLKDWCTEHFGAQGTKRNYRWRYGWVYRDTDTFYFRYEKDALFFALRWS